MKKIIIGILVILGVLVFGFYALNTYIYKEKQNGDSPQMQIVKIYFYDANRDMGEGGPNCTSKGMVAVERQIPKSETPLKDSLHLLLATPVNSEEAGRGYTSEFPISGLSIKSVDLKDGVATIEFLDIQNKTSGGSCRVLIMRSQIEATAKQFESVKSVKIIPDEVFQP